jgi:hydroxymethylbilane synthase
MNTTNKHTIRIGTRDSQLALWQANTVKDLLEQQGHTAELVHVKSEGDIDLVTPLYALGVQGIFTRTLDAALLNHRIDIAVHSMKDVPTQMAEGIVAAAVLPRASYKDVLVPKTNADFLNNLASFAIIATGSTRRRAQWLHRYPNHSIENLRGNVNTRLQKVVNEQWHGAIFAAAGLDRINLRPNTAVELDWMLPAPSQGAVIVVCRQGENTFLDPCASFHDIDTGLCTKIEKDFLHYLKGGCTTPIGALATIQGETVVFKGNILSPDGKQKAEVELKAHKSEINEFGKIAADQIIKNGGRQIMEDMNHVR